MGPLPADLSAALVAAARSFILTPAVWQARKPGVGLDCAGVPICAAWAAGVMVEDVRRYGKVPRPAFIREVCERLGELVPVGNAMPGDVLLLSVHDSVQHIGLLTETDPWRMVHAMMSADQDSPGMVLEDYVPRRKVVGVYRFKEELWRLSD